MTTRFLTCGCEVVQSYHLCSNVKHCYCCVEYCHDSFVLEIVTFEDILVDVIFIPDVI